MSKAFLFCTDGEYGDENPRPPFPRGDVKPSGLTGGLGQQALRAQREGSSPFRTARKPWIIVQGLFIDLVDTYNQSLYDSSRPNDQISGYEYNVLNVLLFDTYGLASLKSNLKLWKPNTVTDEQIDTFLAKYEELLEND